VQILDIRVGMYVVEPSNVTQIEVCSSSTLHLAFSLNWHKSKVEHDSLNNVRVARSWKVLEFCL